MTIIDKHQIRQEKLAARQNIALPLRHQKEQQIFDCFFNNYMIQNSKNIALYYSIKGEVDTILIMQKLLAAKVNFFAPNGRRCFTILSNY